MVENHIEKFINKYGYERYKNREKTVNDLAELQIYPLFGNLQSCFIISQIILPRTIESGKYNVVVTWPGLQKFFPMADEVWTLNSSYPIKQFFDQAQGIENKSSNLAIVMRSLNENFLNVEDLKKLRNFYDDKITDKLISIKNFTVSGIPCLPYNNLPHFKVGKKKSVLIYPTVDFKNYQNNNLVAKLYDDQFYVDVIKNLVDKGYYVYCVQNENTKLLYKDYNIPSVEYVHENDIHKIMSYAYHAGCYIDFFGDLFHIGLLAQVPVFIMAERNLWYGMRRDLEHFILDFTNTNQTNFSFMHLFGGQKDLNGYFVTSIIDRFDAFYYSSVINRQKSFTNSKDIKVGKYLEKKIFKYKPVFISRLLKQKEREKNEKMQYQS